MLDGGRIVTAACQCRFDRFSQLRVPVLLRQLEQLDHLPGAALLAVPSDERFPDPIETRRPQTSLPPLFQRLRSGQRPWLAIENVEIVFEIQDLLLTAVTALVTRDTPAVVPQLNSAGVRLRLH